ncbi:MAG: general secretion pathway protein [Gammaproteobacteria bacterium]|nr:MAG: general secretion pathway protein [Gammaproteobacteria bacterium]
MYKSFYGFKEKPFSLLPDPSFLYFGKKHRAAYSMLEYGLMNQAGFTVITGDVGSGKTTLVRHLLNSIGDEITVGLINNTPKNIGQLLQWVLLSFDQDYREENQVALYDNFNRFLIDQYAQNKRTVLIIDEAQNLHPHVLEELRMLSNINSDKHQVLQIILVGQPQLLAVLKAPELLQFRQRIASDYFLKSLDLEETGRYILHRIWHAGVKSALFQKEAIELIYQASKGVPRVINVLCDTALVYGFAEEKKQIDGSIVQLVLADKANTGLIDVGTSDNSAIQSGETRADNSNSSQYCSTEPADRCEEIDRDMVRHLFPKRD